MITVRQVFEKAFGNLTEDARCHIGGEVPYEGVWLGAFCVMGGKFYRYVGPCVRYPDGGWSESIFIEDCAGPDISDRDGNAFRGFFGPEYDKALDELHADFIIKEWDLEWD
jgi:hypothetical protein